MPIPGGGEDFDPRNHKSVLLPGYERECLMVTEPSQRPAINALLLEADEFKDEWLEAFCFRNGAIQSSERDGRVQTMAKIAVHDEALKRVEAEDRPRQTVV